MFPWAEIFLVVAVIFAAIFAWLMTWSTVWEPYRFRAFAISWFFLLLWVAVKFAFGGHG